MNSTTTTTNKTSTSLTNKTNAKTSARIKKAMMSKHEPTHTPRCDCNRLPSLLHSLPIVTSSSASTSNSSIFDINEHYSSLEKLLDDDDDKDENTLLPASLSKELYRLSTATLVPTEAKPILTSSKKRNVRFVCDHDESTNKHYQYSSSSSATSAANNNNNNNKQDKSIDKNRKKQKRRKVQRRNSVVIRDVAQLSRITDLMKN
ncbi:hypothetical protein FRACYDRAFT_236492 [Fragilariopsis cylindrus CCMP1102]|uniref:Uncharacterized protein n=1 Tax=Fragilariopsis cylindrus CCMP1102 TaxID=635003 RepID=A0A1E7FJ70_9STRA|nr:hypothetical protein FRACYDRAFT_236492 [Fragilariopsis cylindrus CCMP1102]|eukprot:OEU18221.1 hypothetical protein FRACYDRAFT_236492 [Fragilariopsis cylindrus CCMP1102]